MRIVVTGATGNVGTSVVRALAADPEVDEILGMARRLADWHPPRTRWTRLELPGEDPSAAFEGADAVIHLAWAIQPSHDEPTMERVNVEGSRVVFEAAAAAGVPKLVYASSVGAYAPGPKNHAVDESWPVEATPSSAYSRHKVAVERILDDLERRNPAMRVIRMRPALTFMADAAAEIQRLFIGPLLPRRLLRGELVPAVPELPGLRFQAVHSADVGRAYLSAARADTAGAFNIASSPPLDAERLAAMAGARVVRLPAAPARRLMDLAWRLRLQPAEPGWLDLALNAPVMSVERAQRELRWQPQHDAGETLTELLTAMRHGRGYRTAPLHPAQPRSDLRNLLRGGAAEGSANRCEG